MLQNEAAYMAASGNHLAAAALNVSILIITIIIIIIQIYRVFACSSKFLPLYEASSQCLMNRQ
jgi:hypothetical protein